MDVRWLARHLDDTAVVCDNLGMMDAARRFWTLEYVGHTDVRIVDGGWNAWITDGQPTSAEIPDAEPVEDIMNPRTLRVYGMKQSK